jgi:hypothetical protein
LLKIGIKEKLKHIGSGEVKERTIPGQLVFQRLQGNVVLLMDMNSKLSSTSITWEVGPDCPGVEVYQSTKKARRDMLKNLCIIIKA